MDQLSKELFDALAAYVDQRIYAALTPRHQKQFSSQGLPEPAEPQARRLHEKLHAFITEHGKEKKRVAKKKVKEETRWCISDHRTLHSIR